MKVKISKISHIIISGVLFLFVFTACSNPVDILNETTRAVMEANSRYIEVTSNYPAENGVDINPSDDITIDFDRDIDPNTITGNISVTYSDGTNLIDDTWDVEYNSNIQRLTIDPNPWLESSRSVTISLVGIKAKDGSELKDPLSWSFTTNDEPAFDLFFGDDPDDPLIYANKALYGVHGNNIPLTLRFSSTTNVKYLLSTSYTQSATLPSGVDPEWKTPTGNSMYITDLPISSEGTQTLYLWVLFEGFLLSSENKTETASVIVDRIDPSFNLGGPTYVNGNKILYSSVSETGSGVGSYLWSVSGTGGNLNSTSAQNVVFSSTEAESTNIVSLTVTDLAGNNSSDNLTLYWDTVKPTAPTIDFDNSQDTGKSNTDNITQQITGLSISGTTDPNTTVKVYNWGSLFYSGTSNASGDWEFSFNSTIGVSKYEFQAIAYDLANNSASSLPMKLTTDLSNPSGSISFQSTTNSNSVSASLSFSDSEGVWKQSFRNDGSSTWIDELTPQTSKTLSIRGNSGYRKVYYRVYDLAGNYKEYSYTTNYYMPVQVKFLGFGSPNNYDIVGTESWYWSLNINGSDAFSRSYRYPVTQSFPGTLTSALAVYKDNNSAVPYTYTAYINVASTSTDNLVFSGTVYEEDGTTDSTTTMSSYTITSGARYLTTSWIADNIDMPNSTLKNHLNDLVVGLEYRTTVTYAALDS